MTRLEFNSVKIDVPDNWGDITLGFYETIYSERPQSARERVALVAKICKVDLELLLGWPTEVFNAIVDIVDFIFKDDHTQPTQSLTIDNVVYTIPIEDRLSLGAWVDADEVQRKGENIFTNILAIVCRPAGEAYDCNNTEARRAMFAALPVSDVLGVLAFFLHYKRALDRRTAAYSRLAEAAAALPQSIAPSLSPGGGIKLLRIWRIIKYRVLMMLLDYRLRKCLRSFNSIKIKGVRKRHSRS